MTTSKIKKSRSTRFAQVSTVALADKSLSWKAKGVLSYLMSLPDDWSIYVEELTKHSKDGRDATAGAINELISAGYVRRSKKRDDSNKFAGYDYEVSDTKFDQSINGIPVNGFSVNGFQEGNNTNYSYSLEGNNKSIVGKPDDAEKLTSIVKGAITLLNELTKSGFKPESRKTRDTIKARVNEGYTIADFEEVIRHKVADWLHDPKQSQYLRPETLFGSKFEGYLQCAKRANQINQIETLIDIELTEEQGQLYLDYYQYTRDRYPRLFTTTRIIPASEYFALKPGGKRHRGLSIQWSPGQLKSIFKSAHDEAAQLVDAGKHCQAVIEVLNQKLNK